MTMKTHTPLTIESTLEAIGLGPVIEMIGLWGTVAFSIGTFVVLFVLIVGGKQWLTAARERSRGEIAERLNREVTEETSQDEVAELIQDEDNDILTEATTRLEQDDKELTGENLSEALEDIQREAEIDEDGFDPTGILGEKGDRSPTVRMSVAPVKIEEDEEKLVVETEDGETYYSQNMIISAYADRVSYGWLDKLFSSGLETKGADVRVSFHIWRRDSQKMISELNKRMTRLTSRIRKKQKDGDIDTIEEERQRSRVSSMRQKLESGSTSLFDFGVHIQIIADTEQQLNDGREEVRQYLGQSDIRVTPLIDGQKNAFRSTAPIGTDIVRNTQIMDLDSLGSIFPFIEPALIEETGVLMGFHKSTNSPVILDRFEKSGHNALVSGKIGSGKSYLVKLIMWRRLMMDDDVELLVIDPVGGFSDLVESVGGQVITVNSNTIINPLEISSGESVGAVDGSYDPYDAKIRSVMGMFKTHFGSLEKTQEGVLRKAIRYAYLEKGITKDPRTHSRESPIIDDVIRILNEMSRGKTPENYLEVDDELQSYIKNYGTTDIEKQTRTERKTEDREAGYAHQVLLGLEDFQQGGARDNLNGHSNVNLTSRIVQFDLSNVVDANNAGLFMHIVLDFLFQRAKESENRSLVTIDEAHYMLGEEQPLKLLNVFTRHSRHYKTGVTLISQTVDEFMEGEAKEIYDQCDIRVLMKHKDIGKDAIEALGMTEPQRDFVLKAQAGNTADFAEGLLQTTGEGARRLRIYSNDFEHRVIDGDSDSPWAWLYKNEIIPWEMIPENKVTEVQRELNETPV